MILTANTSDELVNALNEEDVISGALLEQSDLFLFGVTDDIRFLYGIENIFAVRTENYPHSSVSIIRQVPDYEAPYTYEDSMTWDSEMLEVSEANVSRARGLLDDVSSANRDRWSDTLEFLQHVYSSAAYWVASRIPEASDTAERILSECLQRNDFDLADDDLSIDDDIVVSHYGEVFTLSDGVVYRGHRFPYTGDYDDCAW